MWYSSQIFKIVCIIIHFRQNLFPIIEEEAGDTGHLLSTHGQRRKIL